jgi:hypothetical protein
MLLYAVASSLRVAIAPGMALGDRSKVGKANVAYLLPEG